jgi:hypothetical protein
MGYMLDGFASRSIPGGSQVFSITVTMPLPGGLTLTFAAPFMPLGNDLAISPVFEPDGEHAVRMRLDRWIPMHLNPVHRFPLSFDSQELAVRIARAVETDPATRWDCTEDAAMTWFKEWAATNLPVAPGTAAG